jgi:hypothetical protein
MNPKQINFAYKVRHALDQNLDNLPISAAEKLASARKLALSRKKADMPLRVQAHQNSVAGQVGSFLNDPLPWVSKISFVIPAIVLITGLVGIYQFEKQQRITDIAEIDALVLSDELPLSAYLDNGFNAYLAKRGQ